ncbi:nucleotidyltransferase family protein [Brevibacterium aurantiacum]|uniref:nucleotidyltransferase family protein n=1 Tax=Brevibacterium aurantiacum TaxID=273384 RepID=UPI001C60D52E|nr:nucleotidyltransferase domain-containing protein [Brevibacterium aurantiacum]
MSAAELLVAAAPILRLVAENYRYTELAVFGSVARGDSRAESDIDLLVQPPPGTSSFDFVEFKQLVEKVLGREIDLISYSGLDPVLDADILHDKRLL